MAFGFTRLEREKPTGDASVVIPVYNHERFVGAAIESVLRQTVRPREIICIDDGSTDGSANCVEALAHRNPAIRFWSRPNEGANRTLNEGIRAATGQYIAILNSDDMFHPQRLACCLAVLEEDPAVALVATGVSFVDGLGKSVGNAWYDEARAYLRKAGDLGLALVNGNLVMTTSNIVARRSVFEEVGDFDDLRYAHDLDFFLRLVVHGKKIRLLHRSLLDYRFHGSNTISESHLRVRLEWAVVTAFFASRLAARPGGELGLDYLRRLLEVADRHQLTRLVALTLLHLQGRGAGMRSPGACLADATFRAALQEAAK